MKCRCKGTEHSPGCYFFGKRLKTMAEMNDPGRTHFIGDDCPGGHRDMVAELELLVRNLEQKCESLGEKYNAARAELVALEAKLFAVLTHATASVGPNHTDASGGPVCYCGQPSTMECGWCVGADLLQQWRQGELLRILEGCEECRAILAKAKAEGK